MGTTYLRGTTHRPLTARSTTPLTVVRESYEFQRDRAGPEPRPPSRAAAGAASTGTNRMEPFGRRDERARRERPRVSRGASQRPLCRASHDDVTPARALLASDSPGAPTNPRAISGRNRQPRSGPSGAVPGVWRDTSGTISIECASAQRPPITGRPRGATDQRATCRCACCDGSGWRSAKRREPHFPE